MINLLAKTCEGSVHLFRANLQYELKLLASPYLTGTVFAQVTQTKEVPGRMNMAAGAGARDRPGGGTPEAPCKWVQLTDNPKVSVQYMKIL